MKMILAVAALLFASLASATCTWSPTRGGGVQAVCTTGTEANALLATDGYNLGSVSGVIVHAEASTPMTAGGVLQAYLYNPISKQWNRAPSYDLTVAALVAQAFPAVSMVSQQLAFLPSGVGVGLTIYMLPASAR